MFHRPPPPPPKKKIHIRAKERICDHPVHGKSLPTGSTALNFEKITSTRPVYKRVVPAAETCISTVVSSSLLSIDNRHSGVQLYSSQVPGEQTKTLHAACGQYFKSGDVNKQQQTHKLLETVLSRNTVMPRMQGKLSQ